MFIIVIGYNSSKDSFELCCSALLGIYSYLKNMWNFKPPKITYYFAFAINNVYKEDEIIILPCLFHLVQAWWRKMPKLGFRKKEFTKITRIIILNLK